MNKMIYKILSKHFLLSKSAFFVLFVGFFSFHCAYFFLGRHFRHNLKLASSSINERSKKDDTGISNCKWDENILVGVLYVNKMAVSLDEIKKEDFVAEVKDDGSWRPTDCLPRNKVAIIIPFRKRERHLPILLRQLHPILQRQKLEYQIFIINQADDYPFNRAKLFNAGFSEALKYKNFDCFVFHDVDLMPEDDRNDYGCPSSPRHMCPAVDKFNYQLFSPYLFGGVTAFTRDHFKLINGYANRYWGWGAEDDDCLVRVNNKNLKLTRPVMELGRYTMLGHKEGERNGLAKTLLNHGEENMKSDGLNTLKYKVLDKKISSLYTNISVDLQMTAEEKNLTSVKIKKTRR